MYKLDQLIIIIRVPYVKSHATTNVYGQLSSRQACVSAQSGLIATLSTDASMRPYVTGNKTDSKYLLDQTVRKPLLLLSYTVRIRHMSEDHDSRDVSHVCVFVA